MIHDFQYGLEPILIHSGYYSFSKPYWNGYFWQPGQLPLLYFELHHNNFKFKYLFSQFRLYLARVKNGFNKFIAFLTSSIEFKSV